jgi:hypothetical protein
MIGCWQSPFRDHPENPTRMTGHGGGVKDQTQWSQRRVRSSVWSQILEIVFGMTGHAGGRRDWTQWWSTIASGPASGPASGRCKTPFFNPIFDTTSPNQVSIQRDSNKHQLEPNMSDLSQTLKFFKIFCLRLVLFLGKIYDKHLRSNVWPCNRVYEPLGAWNALYIHGWTQRLLKDKSKRNDKSTTMHMQCRARKKD